MTWSVFFLMSFAQGIALSSWYWLERSQQEEAVVAEPLAGSWRQMSLRQRGGTQTLLSGSFPSLVVCGQALLSQQIVDSSNRIILGNVLQWPIEQRYSQIAKKEYFFFIGIECVSFKTSVSGAVPIYANAERFPITFCFALRIESKKICYILVNICVHR